MQTGFEDYLKGFEKIEKKLVITTVNVNTGEYTPFTESVGIDNLATIMRASSSVPFGFPPTAFEDQLFMDGGTAWNVNIAGAVDRCLELVEDESHVILDIMITEH